MGFTWASTFDAQGRTLYGRALEADSPYDALGTVIFVHGLGEHGGRYAHVAEALAAAGYASFAYDHEGFGESPGKRGAVRSWASVLDGIQCARAAARARYGPRATYLWAHSMGALVALDYLATHPSAASLAGAILTAPPLVLGAPPPALLKSAAGLAAAVLPNLTKSNDLDARDVSRDPAVVAAYQADPLVHDRISMRLGEALLRLGDHYAAAPFASPVPVLLMHGEEDRIARVTGSRTLAAEARTPVELKTWPGLHHEVHNEPERAEVIAYAIDWLARNR